ncbi:c-type cytochrome [uncultured Ramlibacter sp.]|uniref:c-type cytochrome n=1 Tax=uncultured Ramlibacter sp. TaxID=260755 RepID=UPI002624206C|nr:c-type cytochrome [uncultured Ramlibacter sp.]
MKRWIKWTATGVAVLVLLAAGLAVTGKVAGERKMARHVSVAVQPLAYVNDAQALERGKYLFLSRGCTDCHGVNGGGRDFINDGSMHVRGPNITAGGVTAAYKPEDWVRTIRHGVKPDGRAAMIMPSEDYNRLTDVDLAALVAYVRSLPPLQGGATVLELPLPVRALYGFGAIQDASEKIDHKLPPAQPVLAAVNAQHGAYVASACIGCHGEKLSGGKIPGGPPDWPAAANLTPGAGSAMPQYKDAAAFLAMLRSGKRPDGTAIKVMPFESISKMNDLDAQALYAFLQTLPARPAGGR